MAEVRAAAGLARPPTRPTLAPVAPERDPEPAAPRRLGPRPTL
jgi:hypothetical protein